MSKHMTWTVPPSVCCGEKKAGGPIGTNLLGIPVLLSCGVCETRNVQNGQQQANGQLFVNPCFCQGWSPGLLGNAGVCGCENTKPKTSFVEPQGTTTPNHFSSKPFARHTNTNQPRRMAVFQSLSICYF